MFGKVAAHCIHFSQPGLRGRNQMEFRGQWLLLGIISLSSAIPGKPGFGLPTTHLEDMGTGEAEGLLLVDDAE